MFVEAISISRENFEIVQPVLIVSRLFGLFPVKYAKQGVQFKLQWSLAYGIYSYFICIILTSFTLLGVVNDLKEDETNSIRMKSKKERYVTCCDLSIVVVLVVFSTASLPFKLKQFWKLLRYLNKIDAIIPLRRHEKFRKSSILFISSVFVLLLVILIFDNGVWAHTTAKRHNTTAFFKNYFSFYLLYCILFIQEVFFWHVIFFIKIRIAILNRTLTNLGNEGADKFYKKVLVRPYAIKVGARSGGSQVADALVDRARGSGVAVGSTEKVNIAEKVASLMRFQEKLSEAVASVNNCAAYGVPLIMLSCLLHLIVTPYFLLTEIMNNGNPIFISLQSFWLLVHIGRVLIIVEPCQSCLNEHLKTSVIVYELLSCHFDEGEKRVLTTFAMQLNYCRIKFTSGGFFKIDRSLLTSVAGAVTTYLVILFQFNN